MYRDPMDDIFESFVRAAVIENGLKESEAYPQNDALCDIHLSSKCERSVSRNACRIKRKKKLLKMSKYMQKTVAAVMITIGVSFGFFLSSNHVRAACQDVLIRVYERFIDIGYTQSNNRQCVFNISYIPSGYKEVTRDEGYFKSLIVFENTEGQTLSLKYMNKYVNLQLDNEHYITTDLKDTKLKNAQFSFSTNTHFPNVLFWTTDTGCFTLYAEISEEEIIKIAESIKIYVID